MSDSSTTSGPVTDPGRAQALQVEITSLCNLKCKMCPLTIGATLTSAEALHMDEVTWAQVVTAARAVGRVNMTGFGENTTNPAFVALLKELDDHGVRTSFTTNAIGMSPRIVEALAAIKGLDHINVSIDSPDPAIYREIRGGSVERALKGVETLMTGLAHRVTITVSSVVMASNVESLMAFPEILARLGVRTYILQPLHDRSEVLAEADAHRNPNGGAALEEIRRLCRALDITVDLYKGSRLELEATDPPGALQHYHEEGGGFSVDRTRQCNAPWMYPFIDRSGRVFPCCHGDETSIMGNLAEESFDQVWRNERFQQFRADLVDGARLPVICRSCVNVKLGPHPLRLAGTIDRDASVLTGRTGLRLVVRNTGPSAWTSASPLLIGRVDNSASALHHPSWPTKARIAAMNEAHVPPGGLATFDFQLGGVAPDVRETFGLLFEGVFWLGDAEFDLVSPGPAEPLRVDPPHPPRGHWLARRIGSLLGRS